uniref:Uncharacterized protein n=1 Tax=Setaria digitata TaxID=48799 RepID=A0A915PRH3_9BILA
MNENNFVSCVVMSNLALILALITAIVAEIVVTAFRTCCHSERLRSDHVRSVIIRIQWKKTPLMIPIVMIWFYEQDDLAEIIGFGAEDLSRNFRMPTNRGRSLHQQCVRVRLKAEMAGLWA